MTDIVVHGVPGSPYVRAVLMTLEEKRIAWRLRSIGPGDNRTAAYRAVHPFHKIPTLDHDDFRLYETSAILNYLDRLRPEPALRPADLRGSARVDQIVSMVNAYVMPLVSVAVTLPLLLAPRLGFPADLEAAHAAVPQAREVLEALARLLGAQGFMAGDAVSLADLMLAPHLAFLPDFEVGQEMLRSEPGLAGWLERVRARPSFAATGWDCLLERFPMPKAA